jgi:hypothetical protein
MTRGKKGALLAVLLLIAASLSSCRSRSDKDGVAAVLEKVTASVEDKDVDRLIACLGANYMDFEGRDRIATRAMVEEYFSRYRGIKAKVLASRIAVGEGGTAAADVDVSLYSGVGAALRKAVGFSGENYRVSCTLRRETDWRIVEARWEYVPVQDLFPESLEILRKIFPDL